jgi:hypothetical protein
VIRTKEISIIVIFWFICSSWNSSRAIRGERKIFFCYSSEFMLLRCFGKPHNIEVWLPWKPTVRLQGWIFSLTPQPPRRGNGVDIGLITNGWIRYAYAKGSLKPQKDRIWRAFALLNTSWFWEDDMPRESKEVLHSFTMPWRMHFIHLANSELNPLQ